MSTLNATWKSRFSNGYLKSHVSPVGRARAIGSITGRRRLRDTLVKGMNAAHHGTTGDFLSPAQRLEAIYSLHRFWDSWPEIGMSKSSSLC
jgi:hypothetical protein